MSLQQIDPCLSGHGGLAGAEKAVEKCADIPTWSTVILVRLPEYYILPRPCVVKQVTFESNCGSNMTD
jgi:hypothetical protein